ncbi:MAG: hypothetical protein V9E94_14785 [Microthrixaceae bacterium]
MPQRPGLGIELDEARCRGRAPALPRARPRRAATTRWRCSSSCRAGRSTRSVPASCADAADSRERSAPASSPGNEARVIRRTVGLVAGPPDELAALMARDVARMADLVRKSGAKAD